MQWLPDTPVAGSLPARSLMNTAQCGRRHHVATSGARRSAAPRRMLGSRGAGSNAYVLVIRIQSATVWLNVYENPNNAETD